MGVRAALAFLLLFIATVEAGEGGGVTFWKKSFTMVCPKPGTWFRKLEKEPTEVNIQYTRPYDSKTKGFYHCKYEETVEKETVKKETVKKETTYYFYVKGKACENCFELDAAVFGWTIVGDVVATACAMLIIYRCTKKKSSAGPTHGSKAPARPGGRPPPVQSPDYEQLSPHTLSLETYSGLNRTG